VTSSIRHRLVDDLDPGLGAVLVVLVGGDAGVVSLVSLEQVLDLHPPGHLELAGSAAHGSHDVVVVTWQDESLAVGSGDDPGDLGCGEADGLTGQDHVVVGLVLHVLGWGDDLSAWETGADREDLQLVLFVLSHSGRHQRAQVGVGDVVRPTDDLLPQTLADVAAVSLLAVQAVSTAAVFGLLVLQVTRLAFKSGADVTAPTDRVLVHASQTLGPLQHRAVGALLLTLVGKHSTHHHTQRQQQHLHLGIWTSDTQPLSL